MNIRILSVLCLFLTVFAYHETTCAQSEATFDKITHTYTLHKDGSQEKRIYKELTLHTHTAMNSLYGESFIIYDPAYQELKIHTSYTRQKDGKIIKTPENAFVEVLPAVAANAPDYNRLKEMVVVHTGLELGATIYLDYSIISKPDYLPELDICYPVKELAPIKQFICKVTVPTSKNIHYEWINTSPKVHKEEINDEKTLTWTLKNIKPRPYLYPTNGGSDQSLQMVASGMMPLLLVSTYNSYAEALQHLKRQCVAGDQQRVDSKLKELTNGCENDPEKIRQAIKTYVDLLASHTCKLSLQETSYRLRPASEVIRTAYGTAAELANLSVILLNKAGVEEHFLLSAYRPQNMNAMGLSGLLALSTSSYKSSLQTYMTLTDLEAHPLTVESNDLTIDQHDTLHISEKNVKHLADRYQSIALPVSGQLAYLYAYAHNRSIKENLLLPKKADCRYETIIPLADTLTYIPQNNKEIKNQWGHVSFQYTVEGKNLKVMRKIKIEQQLLTPSNFADFYKLISEWKDENNHLILFTH